MKPFNIIIIASLILIAVGFIFFKDGFTKSNNQILMDRINYLDYSEQNLNIAQKSGRPVLFFAATIWCQTCQALEKEIKERGDSLPPDVTILKVDYDNDKKMNKKYRVTSQHTLIVLDKNSNEIKRWIGGNFDLLMQQLQRI